MLKELLMLLEIAVEGEQSVEDSTETTTTEGGNTEQPAEQDSDVETDETVPSNEFEIDGEKITADQIREWKRGNMRQSDYTRKTQEIAALRKETKEAMELYDYLKKNPEIAKKLAEESPQQQENIKNVVNPELRDINIELNTIRIENALSKIMSQDKDVSEVELLEIANVEHTTIENAYAIWRGRNVDKILEKRLKEQSADMTNKIKSNNNKTKSLISSKKDDKPANFGLSNTEIEWAGKLGMSPEDYAKWK